MTGWLLFAFSGPVLWAISVHLDKYLIERFFKQTSVAVLLVFTALMGVLVLPVVWWFRSGVLSLPALDALVVGFSGILLMGALWFYLQALQSEEASVVAPLFQAAPLFGYLLGYFVLGETLSAVQTIGGLLIIGGALLLSIQPSSRRTRFNGRLIALMLVCTFALASTSLIFKVFAIRDEFWTTTFWTFVGEGVFGAAILAVPRYRRIFVGLLHTNPIAVLSINGANELMNLTGSLGARYALLLAPISLVQAIGSTTSLFVFLFGVAITVFLPRLGSEDLSRANLARKLCAAVVVMIGVILINR
jgi:drug/metabolite transporter (DMT)-like permease